MIKGPSSYLLVQACSARKKQVSNPTPAIELYDGYFYRIIKNSDYNQDGGPNIEIRILSAEHGLLEPDEKIVTYDREMDSNRAASLQESVVETLLDEVTRRGYDEVVINLGKAYRQAIIGFSEAVAIPVRTIEGEGIGEKGHILKQFLNGDSTALGGVA